MAVKGQVRCGGLAAVARAEDRDRCHGPAWVAPIGTAALEVFRGLSCSTTR